MPLNTWSPCLCLTNSGITDLCYYAWFIGDQPQGLVHARQAFYQWLHSSLDRWEKSWVSFWEQIVWGSQGWSGTHVCWLLNDSVHSSSPTIPLQDWQHCVEGKIWIVSRQRFIVGLPTMVWTIRWAAVPKSLRIAKCCWRFWNKGLSFFILIKGKKQPGIVVHTCNLSRRITVSLNAKKIPRRRMVYGNLRSRDIRRYPQAIACQLLI